MSVLGSLFQNSSNPKCTWNHIGRYLHNFPGRSEPLPSPLKKLSFLSSSASCNLIFLSDITPKSSLEAFLQPLAGQTFRLFLHLAVSSCVARRQRWGKRGGFAGGNGEGYTSATPSYDLLDPWVINLVIQGQSLLNAAKIFVDPEHLRKVREGIV